MASDDSGWSKWARNGRLSTIVWGITFVTWIVFKALSVPLEGLDTVFIIMSGAWVTNLGISTVKPGNAQTQRDADKSGDTNG
jgi:hypothetical protein